MVQLRLLRLNLENMFSGPSWFRTRFVVSGLRVNGISLKTTSKVQDVWTDVIIWNSDAVVFMAFKLILMNYKDSYASKVRLQLVLLLRTQVTLDKATNHKGWDNEWFRRTQLRFCRYYRVWQLKYDIERLRFWFLKEDYMLLCSASQILS